MQKPKIIAILGQTASGKSELAVKIAKKFSAKGGEEIISADSRQIYRGLDIGSGKVPRDKKIPKSYISNSKFYFYKGIPHYLIDVASPKRTFTVAQYQKLAEKTLKNVIKRGKIPIICGGTGLYIDALIYGRRFPEVPPQPNLRKKLEKKSAEELFKRLRKLDPRRAENIDKNNRRRLIRALEIIAATKKPVPRLKNGKPQYEVLKIGVKKPPEKLKKLIAERLKKRLKAGMIEEIKNLRKNGVSWKRLDDLGLEYRYVSRYLRGLIGRQEMIESLNKEIYKYARRQMTWFKKDKNIVWIEKENEALKLAGDFLRN